MSIDRIASQPSSLMLLNDPTGLSLELGGDVIARVAALGVMTAKDSQDGVREARLIEEQWLRQRQSEQVQSLRNEATALREAGEWEAFGMITQGACSAAAVAGPPGIDAAGKIGGGLCNLQASAARFEAGMHRADSVQSEHQAGESERRLGDLSAAEAEARELRRASLDFYESAQATAAAADQAALWLRG